MIIALILILFASSYLQSAEDIQSGPMNGYSEMREALVWVQTKVPSEVFMRYYLKGNEKSARYSDIYKTNKIDFCTAKLIADSVEPGNVYSYEIYVNGKKQLFEYPTEFQTQKLWQYRTDPPEFTIAFGSCFYTNEEEYDRPGKSYGNSPEILLAIDKAKPDAMVWLGDNTYLREVDWFSRTGMLKRYTHTRSIEQLQPLLARTHHYAIWDDHDYGPNDSDKYFRDKYTARDVFKLFWGNNSFGIDEENGITTAFQWCDVDFFLMDNRFFRTPNNSKGGKRELLGDEQIEWLIGNLVFSKATFKVICIGGQVLNSDPRFENYILYPEEQKKLIDRIVEEKLSGVIFVSGDKHRTELSKHEKYPLFEFTCSPLTAGIYPNACQSPNDRRVEGTCVDVHNFGLFRVSGKRGERVLTASIHDKAGKELWNYKFKEQDLKLE